MGSPVQAKQPRIQPGRAQQQANVGSPVAIDWGEVVQNVHDRYTLVLGQYVQENAELAAAVSTLSRRNAELESRVAALTPAGAKPGTPALHADQPPVPAQATSEVG